MDFSKNPQYFGYQWFAVSFPLWTHVGLRIAWSGRTRIASVLCCLPVCFFLLPPRMCLPCICGSCGSFRLVVGCSVRIVGDSFLRRICTCSFICFCSVRFVCLFGRGQLRMLRIRSIPFRLRWIILWIQKTHGQRSRSCLLFSVLRSILELLCPGSIGVLAG